MTRDTCRYYNCDEPTRERGERYGEDDQYAVSVYGAKFCSVEHELKHEHARADAEDARRTEPTRSEPADFGGGESTGVQDL